MTVITIEYRVMDGWGNKSEIASRRVYIYESRQYDGFAFMQLHLPMHQPNHLRIFYDNGSEIHS